MIELSDKFSLAIQRIDLANTSDPSPRGNSEFTPALVYSLQMTRWLETLYPQASEALRLAARAQHIRRWEVPRSSYAMDRPGYHRWRTGLYKFHADVTSAILTDVGYNSATIDRVRSMLQKQRLKADAETQALEDVICVVFLENYFAEFAAKHEDEKVVIILRRTWVKMSDLGRAAALKLPMPAEAGRLVGLALAKES